MNNYSRLSMNEEKEKLKNKAKQKYNKSQSYISIIKKVLYYAKDYRAYIYIALFMDIINTICNIFLPIYIGKCINCIVSINNVNFNILYKNMLFVALFAIGSALSYYIQKFCLAQYNYKGTFKIRDLLFEKLQNLPISYIDSTSHGDFISRMINDIDIMTDGFLVCFASALSGLTSIIGTFIAMLLININLALVIIFLTPISLITSSFIVKKSKKYVKKEVELQGELSGYLEEYIGPTSIPISRALAADVTSSSSTTSVVLKLRGVEP